MEAELFFTSKTLMPKILPQRFSTTSNFKI